MLQQLLLLQLLKKAARTELVLYQKVSIGTGAQANNPWLQELPDPISKATWDNYALISMAKAKELGIKLDNDYEYYPEKPVIKLTIGKNKVELPVLVIPGMNADTIAVAVGYGRNEGLGKTAAGVGKNVYPFTSFNGTTVDYYATGVTATNLHKKYKIAQTQIHNSYEGRVEVVRETTLATFKKDPNVIPEYRKELARRILQKASQDFRKNATLYPDPDTRSHGIKWGMSIDMNACTGCGACVVACHAENNVPVVGKSEVLRYHEMHWLRIDRYFISDEKNPDDLKAWCFSRCCASIAIMHLVKMFARLLLPTTAQKGSTKWPITVVSVQDIAPTTVLLKCVASTGLIIPVQIVSPITRISNW